MSPTTTSQQESAGSWSASWYNISGPGGPTSTCRIFNPAGSGDSLKHQSLWANSCSFATSLRLQPSGPSHASPLFIQGVMESLAWSICARLPQLFVAPSPRSYVFTLQNKDHSPVWRRWAECLEFNSTTDAESSSTPAHTCVREPCHSALSTRLPTTPPTTRHADGTSQRRPASVHARRQERQQQLVRPEAQRRFRINQFSTRNAFILIEPRQPSILIPTYSYKQLKWIHIGNWNL